MAKKINQRWAMDLVAFTATTSEKLRYILVYQDIFSRKLFAKARGNNRSATVPGVLK